MRITLAVPWFKKHDAIGNYVHFATRGLSQKHRIRIVCFKSDRIVPGVVVTSKQGAKEYVMSLGLILKFVVTGGLAIISLKNSVIVLLNLMRALLPRARETLPLLLWLLRIYLNSDVLWVHMTRLDTTSSAALLSKMLFGTKLIVDYHGITPSETFRRRRDREQSAFAETIAKNVLPLANAVIVHSQYMKGEVKEKYGVTARVIPLGVDFGHFRRSGREQILNKHMLKGKHVIIYVGRLTPHKRVDVLIRAFVLIRKMLANSALLIIGDGAELANLENLVSTLGLHNSVYFLGECSDEDLPKYYSAADVLVIPSVHEGFCLPIIEAMACGTPVVGSNCTAVRETLGDCGILFDPNDISDLANKILSLLVDEELRKRAVKGGLEHAKSFSWEETTSMLEELFRKV